MKKTLGKRTFVGRLSRADNVRSSFKPSALESRPTKGFSIIEIIVTMAIIGILVLILVPVVSNRSQTARLRATEQDLEHLANAEERAGIDTNYYYRFYVLNDVIGGDNVANDPTNSLEKIDGTRDEALVTTVRPNFGQNFFIDLSTQKMSTNYANLWVQFSTNETTFGAGGWNGPYLNWHRDINKNDWPDDPWGNDYIIFSKAGGMGPNDTDFSINTVTIGTLNAPVTFTQRADLFDRFVILSLGPNGKPGDGSGTSPGPGDYGQGDDLMRQF